MLSSTIALALILMLVYCYWANRWRLMLGTMLLGTTFQMTLIEYGELDLKVDELQYFVFFLLLLPTVFFLKSDTDRIRCRSWTPEQRLLAAVVAAIALLFPLRLFTWRAANTILIYSGFHFLRFTALLACLFYVQRLLRREDMAYVPRLLLVPLALASVVAVASWTFGFNLSYDALNRVFRAKGSFINGNQLSAFLIMAFPYAVIGAIRERKLWLKLAFALSCLFALFAVIVSESKMGYLAMALHFVMLVFFMRIGWRPKLLLAATLALAAGIVLNAGMGARFFKFTGAVFSGGITHNEEAIRLYLWANGVEAVKEHWLLGTGFNTTRFFSDLAWKGIFFKTYHNFYLDFISSNGIIPMLFLIGLVGRYLFRGIRIANGGNGLAVASTLSIIAIIFMNIIENFFTSVFSFALLALAIAVIQIQWSEAKELAA